MIGRAAALLVDLHVDLQPAGWRLVDRPGVDERRARSYLRADLDALEEAAQGFVGAVKVQVCGPWTLAAQLELTRGDKVLSDAGAGRDLVASLAEGVAAHLAEIRRRLPDAIVVVQLDEPSLPAALGGRLRSASGFDVLPTLEASVAEAGLRAVSQAAGAPLVAHCCAAGAPVQLFGRAGAAAVSLDLAVLGERDDDALGSALEDGIVLFLGVVPANDAAGGKLSDPAASVDPVRRLWRRLGLAPERLPTSVVPTPACGLASASPAYARAAMARCREAGRVLMDDPEG